VTLYDTINGVTTEIGTATVGAGGAWSTSVTLSGNGATASCQDTDAPAIRAAVHRCATLDTLRQRDDHHRRGDLQRRDQTISGTVTAAEARSAPR